MIADIILIAIIALCVALGYYRGLVGVAVRILGFVLSLVIALVLYTPISNYIINNTNIKANLQQTIQEKMYKEEQTDDSQNTAEQNSSFTDEMEKYVEEYSNEIKENTSEFVSEEAAVVVIRIGTWVGLFAIARIVMILLKLISGIITALPIIKQFNKLRRNNIWYIRRLCNYLCSIGNN